MKKHIITLLFCSLAISTMNSCRDAIDIVQEGELTNDNVYKNTSDLQRVLDGDVYNSLSMMGEIGFTSMFTDEVGIGPNNSEISVGPHQFYLDTTTGEAESIWGDNYRTINKVLRLLDGAKKISPTAAELPAYNSYIAEAKALRAFSYIQLLSYFSTNMADPSALGVMLLDKIPEFNEKLPRSNNSEVYKVIEDDLDFAENNILTPTSTPTAVPRNASQYFVNKSMIYAVKARYFLYKKDYAKAKFYAQKVLSESNLSLTIATPTVTGTPNGADQYKTAWHRAINAYTTVNPYMRMLQDTDRGEVIFSISRPTAPLDGIAGAWPNIGALYATNSSSVTGSRYDMGRNLFNIVDQTNGDIRKYVYIDYSSKIATDYLTIPNYKKDDALVIDKYPGRSGVQLRNDIKVFRLSEIYFILAECAVRENGFNTAATYIKAVRDARNYKGVTALPTYTTVKEALSDILKERRVELSFEGHRYVDLKRLGAEAGQAIDRSIVDDFSKDAPVTIPMDDYRWTLPIPRVELQANDVIQQNPGYKATP